MHNQKLDREAPSREAGRVEAFSDAVFAIAITLLVLELPVPASGSLIASLLAEWPSFVAYLAAFLTIAGIWVHHHTIYGRVERVEPAIVLWNLLLLLAVSLLPWPAALISESLRDHDDPLNGVVACAIYALVALVVMTAWSAMTWAFSHRPHLLRRPDDTAWMRRNALEASLAGIPVIIALGLALINPIISLALYVTIPVYFLASTAHAPADSSTKWRRRRPQLWAWRQSSESPRRWRGSPQAKGVARACSWRFPRNGPTDT